MSTCQASVKETQAQHSIVETTELTWFQKIAKKIVLKAITSMTEGYLELETESSERFEIGNPEAIVRAKLCVVSPQFYEKALLSGHIGFSEAYMDGDWETPDLEAVISWAILNVNNSPFLEGANNFQYVFNLMGFINRLAHGLKANSLVNSQKNIHAHYDLSNAFFSLFLDPTMTYSSAKFADDTHSLEEAQLNKYESICKKLKLKSDDRILEIGTGWGGFSIYAAQTYGCHITSVTISQEQFDYATKKIASLGLENQIEVQFCDYRNIEGQYDKLVSIEMIEAVGDNYLDTYMKTCSKLISPSGIIAIQMITCPDSRYKLLRDNVDFIQKHIFPGSLLPSVGRINEAINKTSELSLIELEDMGLSYAKTLRLWDKAFHEKLADIRALGFDETFIRKWHYYFMYCSGAFQMRNISVVQAVYSGPNNLNLN